MHCFMHTKHDFMHTKHISVLSMHSFMHTFSEKSWILDTFLIPKIQERFSMLESERIFSKFHLEASVI